MSVTQIFSRNKNKLNPTERFGHISVLYASRYLIVWGGFNYEPAYQSRFDPNNIWVFDTEIEQWNAYPIANEIPVVRLTGACGLVQDNYLYIFGGFDHDSHRNLIYKLDLKNFAWDNCSPNRCKLPSPRDKLSGWVSDRRLFFFGGFGAEINENYLNECGDFCTDPEFYHHDDNLGWNNQLIYFDVDTQTWHNPIVEGNVPLPRAAHCCCLMSKDRVAMFGGRTLLCRTNDLYILDLKTFKWSGNYTAQMDNNPRGRSWMTSVKLSDNEMMVYGGFTGEFDALGDAWIFNIDTLTWTEVFTDKLEKRLWHTAVINDVTKEIYVYGGCFTTLSQNHLQLPKHILKISCNPISLRSKCIDYICSHLDMYLEQIELLPSDLKKMLNANFHVNELF